MESTMKCQVCNKETSNVKTHTNPVTKGTIIDVICSECNTVVKDANNEAPLYLDDLSWGSIPTRKE